MRHPIARYPKEFFERAVAEDSYFACAAVSAIDGAIVGLVIADSLPEGAVPLEVRVFNVYM